MTLPTSEPLSPDDKQLPPARRRRQRRMISSDGFVSPSAALQELAQRVVPSAEFFLFSLLSGLVLGAALLLDSSGLFVLAALLAPFLTPVVGLSLATVSGSMRFFFQSFGSIVVGAGLVFLCGGLAGGISRLLPPGEYLQAQFHTLFTWPDFIVLTLGAGLTAFLLARPPHTRSLPASVAMAYELYLPLGVAAFGLTGGQTHLWPDGLVVFLVHLAWALLLGTLVLALRGLRPHNLIGYTLGTTLVLAGIAALFVVGGFGAASTVRVALPTRTATVTSTVTPTITITVTPRPPTTTFTPTNTLVPTRTATLTTSPQPTPVYARINARGDSGAFVRARAGYDAPVVKTLLNGMMVEVLPQMQQMGTDIWVLVRTPDGVEGWILRPLLVTATPAPGW